MPILVPFKSIGASVSARLPNKEHRNQVVTCLSPNPLLSAKLKLSNGFGEKQVTTWLRCTLFGKRAETLAPMLLKGTKIGITGELTNRKWVDKEGVERYSLDCNVRDITLLGKPTGSAQSQDSKPNNDYDEDLAF